MKLSCNNCSNPSRQFYIVSMIKRYTTLDEHGEEIPDLTDDDEDQQDGYMCADCGAYADVED
jgi:hypothetical protein